MADESAGKTWAPGYYDDGSGRRRLWDGQKWTDQFEDGQPAAPITAPQRRGIPVVVFILVSIGTLILGIIIGSNAKSGGTSIVPIAGKPATGTIPGNGTYLVGTDIQPGTYRSTGNQHCYWARLSDTSGSLDDKIANGISDGQIVVTIAPTDAAFESMMCNDWTLVQ